MYNFWRQCPPNTIAYTVRAGDTYYRLAQRYNTTVQAIISANPMVNPMFLQIGQTICIPRQQVYPPCPEGTDPYIVQRGDTFYSIARRFNVRLDVLLSANPGINPDALFIGQRICIPSEEEV